MKKFTETLKCILPMPYNTAQRFLNSIKKLIKKQAEWNENTEQQIVILQEKMDDIIKLMEVMQKNQDSIVDLQHKLQENQYVIQEGQNHIQENQNHIQENQNFMKESGSKQYEQIDKTVQTLSELKTDAQNNYKCYEKDFQTMIANSNEILWACIFNNAIDTEAWLKNKSFYPGRWAIGYPVLYVLYRILNEVKPKNILELGLGQSTKMITQYAAAYADVKHYVVEHDEDWISFFERDTAVSANTEIVKLDREMKKFLDAEEVRQFRGFEERFKGESFDFIFIDAPLSGDMKQYARVDVLSLIPQNLKGSFVILMDDYNRVGEKNTGKVIENSLKDNGINYIKGVYSGQKQMAIWVSEDNAFLRTM